MSLEECWELDLKAQIRAGYVSVPSSRQPQDPFQIQILRGTGFRGRRTNQDREKVQSVQPILS